MTTAMTTALSNAKSDVRYWAKRVYRHKRTARGQIFEDKHYSVSLAHAKRREQFALATSNKLEAANKARAIHRVLVAQGWDAALEEFKNKPMFPTRTTDVHDRDVRNDDATIGEFLGELRALHASRVATIDDYASSLRRVAASIAGIPSGGRGGSADTHRKWRERVDACKLSILTTANIQKWRERFVVAAGSDPVKRAAARVSANTFLREARSLFSSRYLDGLELRLPEPLPFRSVKLERRAMPRYQSSFDVFELVRAATDELATRESEQFKAFVLAVCAGLRRAEIDKLEWARFNWNASSINVAPTEFFRLKSEDSQRSVWIAPEVLGIFKRYREQASSRFVLESSVRPTTGRPYAHYRCALTFDKLIAWLRSKGVTGEKPLHALRKEFGSLIAQKFGIYAAKEMLGHSDITTTASHYLEAKEKPVLSLL
jgi:integrase